MEVFAVTVFVSLAFAVLFAALFSRNAPSASAAASTRTPCCRWMREAEGKEPRAKSLTMPSLNFKPFALSPQPFAFFMTSKVTIEYNDRVVRQFMIASVVFGVVAMLVGVLIASQLNYHELNLASWLTFGRLRPLHTNAAIFAFVGNMMFAGVYYSTQRLCKVRMGTDLLSAIHFWGWQLIIVAAAITLPLGLSRGQECAELIWPINIAVALIWVVFAVNFFITLHKRNEPSLYVALWFYIATIVTVAMLYIVNHLSIPTSWTHSYTIFAGVQNALVQWWYGHNAVAFFLTTPILGIMYYFMPKAAERRCIPTGCPLCTSGRWSSSTSGPVRITC